MYSKNNFQQLQSLQINLFFQKQMGIFFNPPPKNWQRDHFFGLFSKSPKLSHFNGPYVFLGQLEIPEHISDIIFTFQALFDAPQHEKAMETAKIAVFKPF